MVDWPKRVTIQSTLVKGESNLVKARSKEEFESEKALNKHITLSPLIEFSCPASTDHTGDFGALFEENCERIARRNIWTSSQGEKGLSTSMAPPEVGLTVRRRGLANRGTLGTSTEAVLVC
eukprot:Gb_38541 [translate_table: standard]